jgi:hypothetical protein
MGQIKDLKYNSQRYYISLRKKRNFAFMQVRKKKITVVAMLEPSKIEEKIKHHKIVHLFRKRTKVLQWFLCQNYNNRQ